MVTGTAGLQVQLQLVSASGWLYVGLSNCFLCQRHFWWSDASNRMPPITEETITVDSWTARGLGALKHPHVTFDLPQMYLQSFLSICGGLVLGCLRIPKSTNTQNGKDRCIQLPSSSEDSPPQRQNIFFDPLLVESEGAELGETES